MFHEHAHTKLLPSASFVCVCVAIAVLLHVQTISGCLFPTKFELFFDMLVHKWTTRLFQLGAAMYEASDLVNAHQKLYVNSADAIGCHLVNIA